MSAAYWTARQIISGTHLVRKLGQGGMAELWLGVDGAGTRKARAVALKRLLPDLVNEAEVQALFLDEMRVMGRLEHPGICRLLEMGNEGPVPWLKLELLAGDPLAAISKLAKAAGVAWPLPLVATVMQRAAEALAFAHALKDDAGRPLQIVHRDVSANNVFVCWDGEVKVLDFGIAHAVGRTVRTRTGEFRGNVSYAAPEQVRGEPVDHRADQFSLGVTAFELLTRARVHGRKSNFEVMMMLTADDAPLPRADAVSPLVHPGLADIVARLLSRAPAQRFASMHEVAAALEQWRRTFSEPAVGDAAALSAFVHSVCGPRIVQQAALYEVTR